ncbi:NUDIX hydrolase [Pseudarthrobacter sp. P1]|uniref:NUDIX hydrolase n=1 Tax=Pseudarthrobacter sp. P1 TaxID=3418418 RepID=UPI003CF8B2F0
MPPRQLRQSRPFHCAAPPCPQTTSSLAVPNHRGNGHGSTARRPLFAVGSRSDGLVLLQRRADTGDWEFPSGGCEPGQSFRDCAVAELREETGIDVSPQEIVPFGSLSEAGKHSVV